MRQFYLVAVFVLLTGSVTALLGWAARNDVRERRRAEAEAYERGREAAAAGLYSLDCPYPPGDLSTRWKTGWTDETLSRRGGK